MSCRESENTTTSKGPGPMSAASATWKSTFAARASTAFARATSTDGRWRSKPVTVLAGHREAICSVDCPCPHPTSATRAPASSRGTSPSTAGNQVVASSWVYAVRKNRSTPSNSDGGSSS